MEDVGTYGMSLAQSLGGIFDAVSLDQMADADWAMDWSQPDDFYSSSASYAEGTGSWAEMFGGGGGDDTAELAHCSAKNFGKGRPGRIESAGVYQLVNPSTGKVDYVGRTVDLARRKREHGNDKRFKNHSFETLWSNVTYDEMRGLEQHELDRAKKNGTKLKNKIRGVSKTDRYGPEYKKAASRLIRRRL